MTKERVTGIGGVFFKSADPEKLAAWYREHLGVPTGEDAVALFDWIETGSGQPAQTVWSVFPKRSRYFEAGDPPFMINYRVSDLDRMVAQLQAAGIGLTEGIEESEYGRFARLTDPDGNRIELWEPPQGIDEA